MNPNLTSRLTQKSQHADKQFCLRADYEGALTVMLSGTEVEEEELIKLIDKRAIILPHTTMGTLAVLDHH